MCKELNRKIFILWITSHNWMDPCYMSITWLAPGVEIDFCCCISFHIYRFYNAYFIFSTFLYLLYSQFSLYVLVLSCFCIFRVYLSSKLWWVFFFIILSFLLISLYISGFLYPSYFQVFIIFSIFSSFLKFLYFYAFQMFHRSNFPSLFL